MRSTYSVSCNSASGLKKTSGPPATGTQHIELCSGPPPPPEHSSMSCVLARPRRQNTAHRAVFRRRPAGHPEYDPRPCKTAWKTRCDGSQPAGLGARGIVRADGSGGRDKQQNSKHREPSVVAGSRPQSNPIWAGGCKAKPFHCYVGFRRPGAREPGQPGNHNRTDARVFTAPTQTPWPGRC